VEKEFIQYASVGDRIVIRGHHAGEPTRECEAISVLSADGGPPFLVRWSDTGRESLFTPDPDAIIERATRSAR
jgi:hypothetical protein